MSYATVIKGPAGLGKTSRLVKRLATATKKRRIEYYVPTHELAEEVKSLFLQHNPSLVVKVIGGRSHSSPNGAPLCRKWKLAEEVARAGGEVYSSLCEKKNGAQRCGHYTTCPYIAQFSPADVTIYTHAYLPLHRMKLEPLVPEQAIIDESFYASCIEIFEVPVGLLRASFLSQQAAQLCAQIEVALQKGLPLFDHLARVGLDLDSCIAAKRAIHGGAGITPQMSASQQRAALATLQDRTRIRKLLDVVIAEYRAQRGESQGLTFQSQKQTIKVHYKRRINRFHSRCRGKPDAYSSVLIIDGTADETIIKQWFLEAEVKRISTQRNARVVQCASTRCSTTSLTPERNSNPKYKNDAKKRLNELEVFVKRIASLHEKVLVVGPQAITGNAKAKIKPRIAKPSNVSLAHFNAIRGIDKWKDHDAIIVVGRNEPPIEAVEEIARCVFLMDHAPLNFSADWKTQPRGYRLRNGKGGVDVVTHPDTRVQAVLEQMREAESLQAVDRLRLVHAKSSKDVYILSNIPLDIDVDELLGWGEMMSGSRLRQAWELSGGVMPLEPVWLANNYPQLWTTPAAAKQDVRRESKKDGFPNSISIRKVIPFRFGYKKKSQRRWSVCLSSDSDPAVVELRLMALLHERVSLKLS